MLDACSILCADPVLGCGSDETLGTVFILDTTCVASQVTVDVTQVHKHVTVVPLQLRCICCTPEQCLFPDTGVYLTQLPFRSSAEYAL